MEKEKIKPIKPERLKTIPEKLARTREEQKAITRLNQDVDFGDANKKLVPNEEGHLKEVIVTKDGKVEYYENFEATKKVMEEGTKIARQKEVLEKSKEEHGKPAVIVDELDAYLAPKAFGEKKDQKGN